MKASEAKKLTEKSNIVEKLAIETRKSIDTHIKEIASMGETEMVYSDIGTSKVAKKVVESLKKDGFKASYNHQYDPRDGEDSVTYYIKW